MLPKAQTYFLWPSVIPADQTTQMTITADERAFLFAEDENYEIVVISVDADENYYEPHTHRKIDVCTHNGVLRFPCFFEGEQEHTLFLNKDGATIATFSVYSLREDLYVLSPLKGDLHSHSCRSDGTCDAAAQAGHYREQGYDFVALTDHNRYYPGGEIDETYDGIKTGLTRVLGEEIHSPGSVVHVVHVGGKKSVADQYVHDRANYDAKIEQYMARVPMHILDVYKERYAKAMWATEAVHEAGGLAIFPHPYWKPGASKIHNVRDEIAKILLTSGMFDAYELVGAMEQPNLNRSVALWGDLRAEGLKIPVVGSSDTHRLEQPSKFPYLFTICFAKENTNDAIIAAIKQGNCVAVETSGEESTLQHRCYGSLRLVSYAQFLLKNYFLKYQRLCGGIGVAMRAYAMNQTGASLVEQHAELAQNFQNRFFGKIPVLLPTDNILAFEEKWRAVHQNGPKTRGSKI